MHFLWSLFSRKPALRQFALLDAQGRCQAFKECSVQPAAGRRRLGRNRRNSLELDAPPLASARAHQPAPCAVAKSPAVGRLTEHLIKVIKHAHFLSVLRYNLPPIIRTSPDRASQHR